MLKTNWYKKRDMFKNITIKIIFMYIACVKDLVGIKKKIWRVHNNSIDNFKIIIYKN